MSLQTVPSRESVEACAVKMAKAAYQGNIYEQGAYISGFLQAIEMVYNWEGDDVKEILTNEVRPFTYENYMPVGSEEDFEEVDCPLCSSAC